MYISVCVYECALQHDNKQTNSSLMNIGTWSHGRKKSESIRRRKNRQSHNLSVNENVSSNLSFTAELALKKEGNIFITVKCCLCTLIFFPLGANWQEERHPLIMLWLDYCTAFISPHYTNEFFQYHVLRRSPLTCGGFFLLWKFWGKQNEFTRSVSLKHYVLCSNKMSLLPPIPGKPSLISMQWNISSWLKQQMGCAMVLFLLFV